MPSVLQSSESRALVTKNSVQALVPVATAKISSNATEGSGLWLTAIMLHRICPYVEQLLNSQRVHSIIVK